MQPSGGFCAGDAPRRGCLPATWRRPAVSGLPRSARYGAAVCELLLKDIAGAGVQTLLSRLWGLVSPQFADDALAAGGWQSIPLCWMLSALRAEVDRGSG
jgi:hypothetical protein